MQREFLVDLQMMLSRIDGVWCRRRATSFCCCFPFSPLCKHSDLGNKPSSICCLHIFLVPHRFLTHSIKTLGKAVISSKVWEAQQVPWTHARSNFSNSTPTERAKSSADASIVRQYIKQRIRMKQVFENHVCFMRLGRHTRYRLFTVKACIQYNTFSKTAIPTLKPRTILQFVFSAVAKVPECVNRCQLKSQLLVSLSNFNVLVATSCATWSTLRIRDDTNSSPSHDPFDVQVKVRNCWSQR